MIKTNYERLSQDKLMTLFSTDIWSGLTYDERICACQEVENRYALENGVEPCEVVSKEMMGASYGWQSGNTICLNKFLLQNGEFFVEYEDGYGNKIENKVSIKAVGWNVLDTVYHEGTHGIQEEKGRMANTYIRPDMDFSLYRIQEIEKEAYAQGQNRTIDAIEVAEHVTGKKDIEAKNYLIDIRNDSFHTALQDAIVRYNDVNIENTLRDVIYDRDNYVDRKYTSTSYDSINRLIESQYMRVSKRNEEISKRNMSSQSESIGVDEQSEMIDDGMMEKDRNSSVSLKPGETIDDGMMVSNDKQEKKRVESIAIDDGMSEVVSKMESSYSGSDLDREGLKSSMNQDLF